MEAVTEQDVAAARRHIIRRPRLTRLLDETTAQIIMLVAPAGYGKTTLAEQWITTLDKAAWYQCTKASVDLASLVLGLSEAAEELVRDARTGLSERVHSAAAGEHGGKVLVDQLTKNLQSWPRDAVLVLDDYQLLAESAAAEEVIYDLCRETSIRLLVLSRSRPRWARARDVLYGEVLEVGRSTLAMTLSEARQVLSDADLKAPGIVALAEGWPAVIGLAALSKQFDVPDDEAETALYDYFAQELLAATPPEIRTQLALLGLLSELDSEILHDVFGRDARTVVFEATRVGLVSTIRDQPFVHPLLREFLARTLPVEKSLEAIETLVRALLERSRWDEAFDLALEAPEPELLEVVVGAALEPMLATGRLESLAQWVKAAQAASIHSPLLDLAAAEVALWRGELTQAEVLALEAANVLPASNPLKSRASFVAGRAAHLNDRERVALNHFETAHQVARRTEDIEQALWGRFIAEGQLSATHPEGILDELEAQGASPSARVRVATGRLLLSARQGGMDKALRGAQRQMPLLQKVADPTVRSAFLCAYAHTSALTARYAEGLRLAKQAMDDATRSGLDFVLPHLLDLLAIVNIGLRRSSQARVLAERAYQLAGGEGDSYLRLNSTILRSQAALIEQDAARAAEILLKAPVEDIPSRNLYAEVLACESIAYACLNETAKAISLSDAAMRASEAVEPQTLALCGRAIAALRAQSPDAADRAAEAFGSSVASGNAHGFLIAARAAPGLAAEVTRDVTHEAQLTDLLRRAGDIELARAVGLELRLEASGSLSPREDEVFLLLARGLTNKDIASRLFISEVTVKVHVRHILAKLGVRSRTEAALVAASEGTGQATRSSEP